MPTYAYICPECKKEFDIRTTVFEHRNRVPCACGEEAEQVITPPMVVIPGHMKAC